MRQISDIKKSIKSVKDIKHMTRAMQLISTIKTRKAKKQLELAFPFFVVCAETMAVMLSHNLDEEYPAFKQKKKSPGDVWSVGIVFFSGDQGMAGPYNVNLLNELESFVKEKKAEIEAKGYKPKITVRLVGTVGYDRFEHQELFDVVRNDRQPIYPPTYKRAGLLSVNVEEGFLAEKIDEVYLIYTRLNAALSMDIMKTRVLPVDYSGLKDIYQSYTAICIDDVPRNMMIEFGSDPSKVMAYLMNTYLTGMIYGALSEAFASEQTARMTAMKSATENADELLNKLTISANRARQSMITNEITEIVSGADSLQGN